jgi:hypothetical protein
MLRDRNKTQKPGQPGFVWFINLFSMKIQKLHLLLLSILIGLNLYGQKNNADTIELPSLKVNNKQFISIIDSVISYSEECEKSKLKFLTFDVNIHELSFDSYQVVITLIDCEGLRYRLTSKDVRSRAYGYLIYKNRDFLISGSDMLPRSSINNEITKRKFVTCSPHFYLKNEFSIWIYSFTSDEQLRFSKFYPLCVAEDRHFQNCCDSIIVK